MVPHLQREPLELSSLLRAGVLVITLSGLDRDLSQVVFREVWQRFNQETVNVLRPFCSPQDVSLLEGLSFLIKDEFARITSYFLSFHRLILLRVYLIPFDLPGVQGRLMNRQEHSLAQYRRIMKGMLPRIISDDDYWAGADLLPQNPDLFFPPSLVGIFVDSSRVVTEFEFTTGL